MTENSTEYSPAFKASLWMGGALASFIILAVGGRELSPHFNTFEILFYRSLTGLFLLSAVLTKTGWSQIITPHPVKHVLRNIIHFGGQFGWFYGIAYIPLAEVFAIEFTVPLWTAVLAVFFLKEKITPPRAIAIILGLTGMVIILRPGTEALSPAALAVLAGAFCFSMSHILVKQISLRDTPLCVLFYMALFQLPMAFIPAAAELKIPGPEHLPWIGVVGFTALSAHYCIVRAFKHADASVVVPMDFLRLPLAALTGFILYGESADIWILLGAAVMFAGNYISIKAEAGK